MNAHAEQWPMHYSDPFPWTHYLAIASVLLTWVLTHYFATRAIEAIASAWRRRGYRKQWAKLTAPVHVPAPRPYPPVIPADVRPRAVR